MADGAKQANDEYGADDIKLYQGIAHVRHRPAMYIGDVGEKGLHHLISEVLDNSVDEALAGFCSEIIFTLHEDGSASIEDNGRGIPVDMHESGRPTVEVVMTEIGAGGKFEKGAYQVSGGLHGVGVSCVNALSQWLEVEVCRDGKRYSQRYERAEPTTEVKELGASKKRGTTVRFLPDPDIFKETTTFKFNDVIRRLRELAYLNPGLRIIAKDLANDRDEVFHFEDGLKAFVKYLSGAEDTLLNDPIFITGSEDNEESGGRVEVEIAVLYNSSYATIERSYVNDIHTGEGGTHITGFKTAFTASFNNFLKRKDDDRSTAKARKSSSRKKSTKLPSGDAYREGMVCVISAKVPEPQFGGQTKTKLGNPEISGIVTKIVGEALSTWIEENPKPAQIIANKALEAQRVKDAVRKARDIARKTGKSFSSPKKLADCASKKPEECEIFLVEGDSAGGSARQGRDAHTQAILPLRGKILNVWKSTPDRMLNHEEIKAIVTALGTGILEDFDEESCRYHKIIIMCDADVDGSHIRTLLLTFLFRQMPRLIEKGYVYLAAPPLFGVQKKGSRNKAKWNYILDDETFRRQMHRTGLDGTVLRDNINDRTIEGEDLVQLKRLLEQIHDQDLKLSRRGLTLQEYLDLRNDKGEFLHARVSTKIEGKPVELDLYSEQEYEELVEMARATKRGGELEIWRDGDSYMDRARADIQVSFFRNKMAIAELMTKLEGFGFKIEQYFGTGAGGVTDEMLLDKDFDIVRAQAALSPLQLENEEMKKTVPVDTLSEVPRAIVDMAKGSIVVKRFKGLGEMNAEELWDTTMDPNGRKLYKVTLEDTAEAMRSFSVLMGSKVEPRRDFIEAHALDVADLDV